MTRSSTLLTYTALSTIAATAAACEFAEPPSKTPAAAANQAAQPPHDASAPAAPPLDWARLEAPLLRHHIQITSRDKFVKAGEAYFSPDSNWIIFQAVAVPEAGKEPDPFYAMYIAKLTRDPTSHRITGTEDPIKVSPPDSANTCGWFHPKEPWHIIFGSTLVHPKKDQKSGFKVQDRKYVWMFPDEMDVVTRTVPQLARNYNSSSDPQPRGDLETAKPLFSRSNYDAECSYSPDDRFILYAHVRDEPTRGRPDADIFVYDTVTKQHHPLVTADGYDGGPFFSPDAKRICYRSDRKGDDLLQLFIADLKFDTDGVPVGISREHQITDDSNVNWAPFWHPSGRFLVFGTSAQGHQNYEVYCVQADPSVMDTPGSEIPKRRITFADGADVLPAFNADGSLMMWTAQRGPMAPGETKPSSQLWIAECTPGGFDTPGALFLGDHSDGLTAADILSIAKAEMLRRNDDWADRGFFETQRTDSGWTITATHPSHKPGAGRRLVIDRHANLVSYDTN